MATSTVQRWPMLWRTVLLINVAAYNMLGNAYTAGVPPLFAQIIAEFRIDNNEASKLSTYPLLTLGISNILALPSTALIGKRYTVLISMLLFMLACIWSAEATSFDSLLASRVLGGLAAGLIEALGPSFVTETFPAHQLATAMVIYVGFLAAGSAIGPLVAGTVAKNLGSWRWYLRIVAITIAVNLASSLIMLPETTPEGMNDAAKNTPQNTEDDSVLKPNHSNVEENSETPGRETVLAGLAEGPSESPSTAKQEYFARSWSRKYVRMDWNLAIRSFYRVFEIIILPQVLVTTLVFGLTIGWTVLTSVKVAAVYSQPPLLWDSASVGNLNTGPLVGLLIGLPFGGVLADTLFKRDLERVGYPRPQARLPAVLLGAIISPSGCILLGYGLSTPEKWALVAVGWGMIAFGLSSSANILLTYSVDTIPSRAVDVGCLVNLAKNCLAFGVSYATFDWGQAVGTMGEFSTMAGLLWFAYLLLIPMWIWSEKISEKSIRLIRNRS